MTSEAVVIVTGGGGAGCGRAISRQFGHGGAAVIVADIDEPGGRETVSLIESGGGRAAFFCADVRSDTQVKELVSYAERRFGRVSILINNASAPSSEAIDGWTNVIETDLLGAMYATRWAIEAMKRGKGGVVVNIASISALWHGRKTPGGFPGYDVAKAGLIRMTTRHAGLSRKDGIRINCLAPGWIATEGVMQYWESLTPEQRRERGVPSRLLAPKQVAELVVRLAEDQSLNGRVVIWWSEDAPRMIEWGDRGYRESGVFE